MTLTNVIITPTGQIQGAGPAPLMGLPAALVFANGAATVQPPTIVPLQPVAAQQLSVSLGNQACTIRVLFRDFDEVPSEQQIPTNPPFYDAPSTVGFLDLYVGSSLIIAGVRAMDRNLIVRDSYLGFSGDLSFVDTQGTSDPVPVGLGSRYLLTWWSAL